MKAKELRRVLADLGARPNGAAMRRLKRAVKGKPKLTRAEVAVLALRAQTDATASVIRDAGKLGRGKAKRAARKGTSFIEPGVS